MPQTYKLKFMFDWGSGVCLWSANKKAEERFGDYPIPCSELPVSLDLKKKLERLIEWHDEALNWNEPSGDLLWNDAQVNDFLLVAKDLYQELCDEMSDNYEIEFMSRM